MEADKITAHFAPLQYMADVFTTVFGSEDPGLQAKWETTNVLESFLMAYPMAETTAVFLAGFAVIYFVVYGLFGDRRKF